jgi:hypothetical protein
MDYPLKGLPNPFKDVQREASQEIDYRCNRDDLRLIGFGIDAKELYVQFSFVEETHKRAQDIVLQARDAMHEYEWDAISRVDFTIKAVVNVLMNGHWEPAAAASLVTILSKKFGSAVVNKAIAKAIARKRDSK